MHLFFRRDSYFWKNYLTANICQSSWSSCFLASFAAQQKKFLNYPKSTILAKFYFSPSTKNWQNHIFPLKKSNFHIYIQFWSIWELAVETVCRCQIDLFSICLHCKAWIRGSCHYFFVYFASTIHASKRCSHAIWTVENELVVLSRLHRCRLDRICGV
jgi:hypothetical protein